MSPELVVAETSSHIVSMHPSGAELRFDPVQKRPSKPRLSCSTAFLSLYSSPGVLEGEMAHGDFVADGEGIFLMSQKDVEGVTWFRVSIISECKDPLLPDWTGWIRADDVHPIR